MAEEKKKKYYKELEDLPGIGEVTAEKLRSAGYEDFSKIAAASPHELSEIGGMGVESAKKAIEAAKTMIEIGFESADLVFERRKSIGKITTGSKNLDELLGGRSGNQSNYRSIRKIQLRKITARFPALSKCAKTAQRRRTRRRRYIR